MLTHAVFKGNVAQAISFSKFEPTITQVILHSAKRYGIKIKASAVHHDHIHLLFYTRSREAYCRFLRFFSAEMGRRYARLYRRMKWRPTPLWTSRPFTRLVSWGKKSLDHVRAYIRRNRWEALGFIKFKPRSHSLSVFLRQWENQRELSSA